MKNNEFTRNIWLEFSLSRALVSPFVIGAIVLINYFSVDSLSSFYDSVFVTSTILMGFILMIWGCKQAAESIVNEVNEQTWISQKMTGISAWNMAIGKLFGSTIFTWYSVSFCIAVYLISGLNISFNFQWFKFLLAFIMSVIIGHSISILVSLIHMRNNKYKTKINRTSFFIPGVAISVFIIQSTYSFYMNSINSTINWYNFEINISDFCLITCVYLLFWSIIGLYRSVRIELQYDNSPWVWLIFIFSFLVYINGIVLGSTFVKESFKGNIVLWTSYLVLVAFSYLSIMIESFNPVLIRKLLEEIYNRNIKAFINTVPLWLVTLFLSTLFCLLIVTTEICSINGFSYSGNDQLLKESSYLSLPIILIFLIIRDLSIISIIKGGGSRRSGFFSAIYFLSVYALIPSIFYSSTSFRILHFFWPVLKDGFYWETLPIAFEAIIVAYFVFKKRYKILGVKEASSSLK